MNQFARVQGSNSRQRTQAPPRDGSGTTAGSPAKYRPSGGSYSSEADFSSQLNRARRLKNFGPRWAAADIPRSQTSLVGLAGLMAGKSGAVAYARVYRPSTFQLRVSSSKRTSRPDG